MFSKARSTSRGAALNILPGGVGIAGRGGGITSMAWVASPGNSRSIPTSLWKSATPGTITGASSRFKRRQPRWVASDLNAILGENLSRLTLAATGRRISEREQSNAEHVYDKLR